MTIGGIALIAILVIALIVSIGASMSSKKKYEKKVAELTAQVTDLTAQVTSLGATELCYQLAHDVKSNTEVKDSDLIEVAVPVSVSGGYVHDKTQLVGKYYKIGFKIGTTLSADMVFNSEITPDMRYLDVVCDEVPIGLQVDSSVDVRISFTLGQTFIGMTDKRVVAIYGNTVKLIVDNKDIYTYESMKVDKAIYKGTKVYCLEFVEGGVQGDAMKYYPLRIDVLATLLQDPNIDGDLKQYEYVDRQYLEEQLALDDETLQSITAGKDAISQIYTNSLATYERIIQEQKQKADQQAALDAATAAANAQMQVAAPTTAPTDGSAPAQ